MGQIWAVSWESGTERQELLERIRQQDARIQQQDEQIRVLLARIAELEERLKQNSQNSSKPPSSDPPGVKLGPKKVPSGRKAGGQSGHKKWKREMLPASRVDDFVNVWPERCEHCEARLPRGLRTEVCEPERHQVTEVPPVVAHVTEYVMHAQECGCGHVTQAGLPAGTPCGAFGPRLQAVTALFTGTYRLSKRTTATALGDLFGVKIALGSIAKAEQTVSAAIAAPVEQARRYVQQQPVINADETSWRQKGAKAWLWIAATPLVTVFLIHAKRSTSAARQLLGSFQGILSTDRWSAYSAWSVGRRQLCWAHLLRDFHFISEAEGLAGMIGTALVRQTKNLIRKWHRARDGTLAASKFDRFVVRTKVTVETLLMMGRRTGVPKVSGMCAEILSVFDGLWTFTKTQVEPTNNLAERCLRSAVLWRKTSFGTQSSEGSRYAERMMTVTGTLKLQGRNVLEFLAESCESALLRRRPPTLLPTTA